MPFYPRDAFAGAAKKEVLTFGDLKVGAKFCLVKGDFTDTRFIKISDEDKQSAVYLEGKNGGVTCNIQSWVVVTRASLDEPTTQAAPVKKTFRDLLWGEVFRFADVRNWCQKLSEDEKGVGRYTYLEGGLVGQVFIADSSRLDLEVIQPCQS